MEKQAVKSAVIHNTFVIERSYPATPDRVFAALSDPAKKRRWFVEGGGHEVDDYAMDFQVGGKEIARFRFKKGSPVEGLACATDSVFQVIAPNARLVLASTMKIAGNPISSALITFELLPTDTGTDLILTHQGAFYEGSDGPEMRQAGWRHLLDRLSAEFQK